MVPVAYSCSACGRASPKWFGRCEECGAWNSARPREHGDAQVVEITSLENATPIARLTTGSCEVDRVLGGGLVPGSCILLTGEPGIGKSTLVLQLARGLAASDTSSLLVTGEESLDQVRLRAARIGVDTGGLRAGASTSLENIIVAAEREQPALLVVDSIQALAGEGFHATGSVARVRECAASLIAYAKRTNAVVLLIGHVTKDGVAAGPKALEHLVDVVLELQGERAGILRVLRCLKNRFGPCDESAVFVMQTAGLEPVADPSSMLLADRRPGVPGSVVFCGLDGSRPYLAEVQALVVESQVPQPRRVAIGVDPRRLAMLIGVLSQHASLPIVKSDVFVTAVGGIAVNEPAADLAICTALWSALTEVAVDARAVIVGEVGLGGEVRRIPHADRRLAEAARLGFRSGIVPATTEHAPRDFEVARVPHVTRAFSIARSELGESHGEPCYPLLREAQQ